MWLAILALHTLLFADWPKRERKRKQRKTRQHQAAPAVLATWEPWTSVQEQCLGQRFQGTEWVLPGAWVAQETAPEAMWLGIVCEALFTFSLVWSSWCRQCLMVFIAHLQLSTPHVIERGTQWKWVSRRAVVSAGRSQVCLFKVAGMFYVDLMWFIWDKQLPQSPFFLFFIHFLRTCVSLSEN